MRTKIFNSLFWKISGIFLLMMVILALIFVKISIDFSEEYHMEAQQKINRDVAAGALKEVKPIFIDNKVNEQALHTIMHSMMAVNPSIEVYLLDPRGEILTYVVPYKEVLSSRVSLDPIKAFIDGQPTEYVKGDDPRNPGEQKAFTTAPIIEDGEMKGYLYIILASKEYTSAMGALANSYILGLGLRTMVLAFLFTTILGLLSIAFITRNINRIVATVKRFREGDLSARISVGSKGELSMMSETFNSMAEKIQNNIEELKSVEKLRRELIANISHDLRSPIASIQGFTETILLKKDSLSEEQSVKYLNIIAHNTNNLSKLVNDLFELSKLEANPDQMEPEPVQIAELVQDITDKFRLIAKEKNISINTIFSKSLPLVYADIQMTDRVFQNIIDNAIKYCNRGDVITVELELHSKQVLVRIKDTGTGIAQEDLPYIFDRYFKKQKNMSNSTGLGLAIVKKILDLHQSSIKVFSEVNRGTTFEFALPVYQA